MTLSSKKQIDLRSLFSVLSVAVGVLSAIAHVVFVYLLGDTSLLPLALMFWLSTALLVWQKRHKLVLKHDAWSQLVGIVLLGSCAVAGLWVLSVEGGDALFARFLSAAPFLIAVGVGLLSTSWRYLGQYRLELLLLFFFGMPKALLWTAIDLRETTARFSTFLLHLLGWDAVRYGRVIALPAGSVEVIKDCSGLNGILYLMSMAALLLVMLPLQGVRKYVVPLLAVVIAYLANGGRVVYLAIANANPDPAFFDRVHGNTGFSLGALVFFCAVYGLLYWQENRRALATRAEQ